MKTKAFRVSLDIGLFGVCG